jgi:hypothetical protein
MYVFKYAEETFRSDGDEPWSIRQSAFYHQIRKKDQRSVYILISPMQESKAERQLLSWAQGMPNANAWEQQAFLANEVVLGPYLNGWRSYLRHYERRIEDLVRMDSAGVLPNY